MSNLIGTIAEFDATAEQFQHYLERVEIYFDANTIVEEKRAAILLSLIGSKNYLILRNLVQPLLPKSLTYAAIVQELKAHFSPKPIVIAERFKFYQRSQLTHETVSEFLVEIRRLASTCDYGTFLEQGIRDRFVCGLKSTAMQKRLLSIPDLSLTTAVDTAVAMELTEADLQQMKPASLLPEASAFSTGRAGRLPVRRPARPVAQSGASCRTQPRCSRCDRPHVPDQCKFKSSTCHYCGMVGHIAPACRKKKLDRQSTNSTSATNYVMTSVQATSSGDASMPQLFSVGNKRASNFSSSRNKFMVNVKIEGKPLEMHLDTAADLSTVGSAWLSENIPDIAICKDNTVLRSYTGDVVSTLGSIRVSVTYKGQNYNLNLIVVSGDRPALLGRDWLARIHIDWHQLFAISDDSASVKNIVSDLQHEFADVFAPATDPIKGIIASIQLKPDAKPVFKKFRTVPFSLRAAVEERINANVKAGLWEPVEHSQWATPLVIVPKKSGDVRLCGDYKVTVNPVLDITQYPLPSQRDIFATLNGGIWFSSLDCQSAYELLEVDKQTQEILTVNTHLGLMRPTRLMFGIASAAAIFQRSIDHILKGINSVNAFQDDILAANGTVSQHHAKLRELLLRLREHNVALNASKCHFFQKSIKFLGHVIDAEGIHPTSEKIDVIKTMSPPSSVTELKSFLGIVNYYAKFFPDMSTLLSPLFDLLHKNVKWNWSSGCREAFERCKQFLTSDALLVHYDINKPVKIFCDASATGLGVVLSHVMPDGRDRPVAYASRTLSPAEKNYSQIEREALAIVYAIKHFQVYLVGRSFTIVTDHQPLVAMFGPKMGVPLLAAARLQRWALLLAPFSYTIEFKRGVEHLNADALSRIRSNVIPSPSDMSVTPEASVYKLSHLQDLPVTSAEIAAATRCDPVLGRVLSYVQSGWPVSGVGDALNPFYTRRDQLSVDCGCVVWGMRVVIPDCYQETIVDLLHDTHQGMSRMKALARSYVWWPGLDSTIERAVRDCACCQALQPDPPRAPHQPWSWPTSPWHRVHIDLAHVLGHECLIVIDTHSKWIEAIRLSSLTSYAVIVELRKLFAQFGLPVELVSDNGPQFSSDEFAQFTRSNGVRHVLVPAYHPATNGAAERAVRVIKDTMKHMSNEITNISNFQTSLSRALFTYRFTPHTLTGQSPCELFLGRAARTRLSLLRPGAVVTCRPTAKIVGGGRAFKIGQKVWVRNFGKGAKWIRGVVSAVESTRTYKINCNNSIRTVHVDQLREDHSTDPSSLERDEDWPSAVPEIHVAPIPKSPEPLTGPVASRDRTPPVGEPPLPIPLSPELGPPELGRPKRASKPPNRYGW